MDIKIIQNPDESMLEEMGVKEWPIWEKEVSSFPWSYDTPETCYILEGKVIVTPERGDPVEIKQGDLVTFPTGLRCTGDIRSDIRKHYRFGS